MLVLTRKAGERIFIGKEVVLTVTSIGSQKVCLGIEAPRTCAILREELVAKADSKEKKAPIKQIARPRR